MMRKREEHGLESFTHLAYTSHNYLENKWLITDWSADQKGKCVVNSPYQQSNNISTTWKTTLYYCNKISPLINCFLARMSRIIGLSPLSLLICFFAY